MNNSEINLGIIGNITKEGTFYYKYFASPLVPFKQENRNFANNTTLCCFNQN